ncbi:hypothetical protein JTB14_035834 [Gonioctena quinquepunctata]|nr:hypothetical protein JTB14_035834 [Gonioctena quinquepunctata]
METVGLLENAEFDMADVQGNTRMLDRKIKMIQELDRQLLEKMLDEDTPEDDVNAELVRGTGGGPYLENPNRPFDQEVLDTINTVSLEGHEQVLESATEFVLAYDGENESADYALDQRCDFENVSTGPIMNDVSTGHIVNDISNAEDDSQISSKNIVQSNSACTQVKGRPCPRRVPRKKLLYAAEASNNYRISLEKKNDIKSKYYEKNIILLERIATAKERSAAAQEDIANKLGCLEGAIESLQDAIA